MTKSEVIIIGSGFSGMCTAIRLKKLGVTDIVILEREKAAGGTWWRNNYPGAAVDVASDLYSFSFEHKNWSRRFAKQKEILDYTNNTLDKYGIRELVKTNEDVAHAKYDETESLWHVQTQGGNEYVAPILVNAIGHLCQSIIPNIDGLDEFKGQYFHSARWNHEFDWHNKRIGVIGTGASAIQIVPAIAERAQHVHVFQRTPHWIVPRHDKEHGKLRSLIQSTPIVGQIFNKLARALVYCKSEARVVAFQYFPALLNKIAGKEALHHMQSQIPDPTLREQLTPNYTIGCKRILISNDYYPALCRENVSLQTQGIKRINETGIELNNGEQVDLDLIVFATGFAAFTSTQCLPFDVVGSNNQSLREEWAKSAHAYVGVSIPGFPNFFCVNGPNTGIGHTSAIFMIESQVNYIINAIKYKLKNGVKTIEIKPEAEQTYNQFLQSAFKSSVWNNGGCQSWYLTESGENTSIFPTFTFVFRSKARKFLPNHHIIK